MFSIHVTILENIPALQEPHKAFKSLEELLSSTILYYLDLSSPATSRTQAITTSVLITLISEKYVLQQQGTQLVPH